MTYSLQLFLEANTKEKRLEFKSIGLAKRAQAQLHAFRRDYRRRATSINLLADEREEINQKLAIINMITVSVEDKTVIMKRKDTDGSELW